MLVIITASGEKYKINTLGQIIRTDMPFTPSNSWTLTGITHVRTNINYTFAELTPDLIKSIPLLFKNGNPQFTVVDCDHGTQRVWGNTKAHGIRQIYFETKD